MMGYAHRVVVSSAAKRLRLLSTLSNTFHQPTLSFNTDLNILNFPDQSIFAGTEALALFVDRLKAQSCSRPLIVADAGVSALGIVDEVVAQLRDVGMTPFVFDECTPDPSHADVAHIAAAFEEGKCDSCTFSKLNVKYVFFTMKI